MSTAITSQCGPDDRADRTTAWRKPWGVADGDHRCRGGPSVGGVGALLQSPNPPRPLAELTRAQGLTGYISTLSLLQRKNITLDG